MTSHPLPCVLFAYKRPDKMRQVLAALRSQEIERLIVFVDGPRKIDDEPLVNKCQLLAQGVDWVETECFLWEENRGLNALLDHISLVLDKYPWAVILEDDCLPVPGFYNFMRRALEYYQDQQQVFSIGGYQPLPAHFFTTYPYSLVSSMRFSCWGWATWRDRWQQALPLAQRFFELFDNLQNVPEIAGAEIPSLARSVAAGKTASWATKVVLAALALSKVHLLPVHGLVRNTGAGLRGEHSGRLSALGSHIMQNRNVARQAPANPIWLEDVSPDSAINTRLKEFYFYAGGNLRRRLSLRGQQFLHKIAGVSPGRFFDVFLEEPLAPVAGKRALLSYLAEPMFMLPGDPRLARHPDFEAVHGIVRLLNRQGYLVDVIDYRERSFKPGKLYNIFLGVGSNFDSLAPALPSETKKILLAGRPLSLQFQRSGLVDPTLAKTVIVLGNTQTGQDFLNQLRDILEKLNP